MISVAQALARARAQGVDRLDAQLLLGHLTGRTRAWLLAHDDAPLEPAHEPAFEALLARRTAGEPLAYLVGEREFHGLALAVGPGVLVPRPDTETLVDWGLELLARPPLAGRTRPAVIDLGTGSGAIALALKHACPRAQVWAVERSTAALEVARGNAGRLGLDLHFAAGDWWAALATTDAVPAFDLVVSNPPYIAPDDPHLAALSHEPREALVAADDGLADIVRIARDAPARMAAGGWLVFEHGWTQAEAVARILAVSGFDEIESRRDIEGRARCTGGRRGTPETA